MITTIVLVRADPQRIPETARALAGIDGVHEVYSVSGEWDLVVIVKVPEYSHIAEVVTEKFPAVQGSERPQTRTAFRAVRMRCRKEKGSLRRSSASRDSHAAGTSSGCTCRITSSVVGTTVPGSNPWISNIVSDHHHSSLSGR